MKKSAFTLMEVILVIAILAILSAVALYTFRPFDRIEQSQAQQALSELADIAKAVQLYSLDNGGYPQDVSRGLPAGLEVYLSSETNWNTGPFPGSIYDYDNWSGMSCIDNEASGTVQVTLRNVPNRNPDGSNVWAWYYPIHGKGTPHCSVAGEYNKGECVTCDGFQP